MKAKRILSTAVLVLGLSVSVSAQNWTIDAKHSSVDFQVKHMVVSRVNGTFNQFEGAIRNFDGKNLADASVAFTVQAASVDTRDEKRDGHLKSPDFFALDSFPVLTFTSTQILPGDGSKFQIVGDLTIRGVTKPVTFDAELLGVIDAFGGQRAGFTATGEINRKDFNVNWSKALDNGGLVVSDEVKIMLELEVIKEQPQG